jgi:hypothetical protein
MHQIALKNKDPISPLINEETASSYQNHGPYKTKIKVLSLCRLLKQQLSSISIWYVPQSSIAHHWTSKKGHRYGQRTPCWGHRLRPGRRRVREDQTMCGLKRRSSEEHESLRMMRRRGCIGVSTRCLRRLSKDRESSEKASRLIVAKRVAPGSGPVWAVTHSQL